MLLHFVILLLFVKIKGFLDIDELKSVNYGIDIVDKPVVMGQDDPGAIFLTSMYGQQYQCSYQQTIQEDREKEKEEEQIAMDTGIPELLKPMEAGPCLVHTKGWWSYEFCYGKFIRQYHMEDGKITSAVIHLGFYEGDFNWNNETEKSKTLKLNRLSRYHSQKYVNGSECDLTNVGRRTEVRFLCEEGQGDYVSRVDEPESCVYNIYVHTTKICHHPYLKPAKPSKPVPITCNPLLSHQDYQHYILLIEAEKKAKEDAIMKTYKKASAGLSTKDETESGEASQEEGGDALNKLFVDSLAKSLQAAFEDTLHGKETAGNVQFQTVKDINDLDSVLSETFKDTGSIEGQTDQTDSTPLQKDDDQLHREQLLQRKQSATKDRKKVEEEEEEGDDMLDEEDDKEVMEEFDKGLDEIAGTDAEKARLSHYKDAIASSMQSQFDEIISEAEQELHEEGMDEPVDKTEAFKSLARTLNKLLQRLDHADRDIKAVDKELDTKGRVESRDTEAEEEEEHDDVQDDDDDDEDSIFVEYEDSPVHDQEDTEAGREKPAADKPQKGTTRHAPSSGKSTSHLLNDGVRVRVTRVKETGGATEAAKHAQQQSQTTQTFRLEQAQREQLESKVKKELEKAGMETHGRKIEVKIITADYYDDGDTLHVLTDDETNTFNKMVIAVLGANDEEMQEVQRQRRMEYNYNYVWSKNKKDSTEK